MLVVPLYSFLFLYFAFLIVFFIFAVINLSHLRHTGAISLISFFVTFLIGALTIFTFYITYVSLMNVDWKQPVTLWNNDWATNNLNITPQ